MKNIGIYIHIPFCNSKCFYCDFYSKTDCKRVDEYIDCLCEEILLNIDLLSNYNIDTVYFGGGTPSYIDGRYIVKIMDLIHIITPNIKEVTIEVNPESVTQDKLKSYKEAGINRISIGLQSVNDETLRKIGRKSSFKDFNKALKNIIDAGFKNISVDTITGLPNETLNDFKKTVNYILSVEEISHVSSYSLEVHKNTKLDFLIKNDFLTLPDEDVERDMKHFLDDILDKHGFTRYEISNYARENFKSKHNFKYWNQEEYLGFGAAASSFINSTRYTNVEDIDKYIDSIKSKKTCVIEKEEMDKLDLIKEYIILRLRLKDGVILKDFKNKFKKDIFNLYKEEILKLQEQGLICNNGKSIYLTDRGEDLANIVWQEFI